MANTSRINGFRPVQYKNGSPYTGKARMYVHAAGDGTALHIGDLVIQGASSQDGLQAVTRATDGTAGGLVGAVVGIDWVHPGGTTLQGGGTYNLNLSQVYIPVSTLAYVWVADDPAIVFEAEFDSAGDMPDQTDVGLNYDFLVTAGNTTTGASGMTIDASSEVTTAATPLKLVGLARRPDNDITDAATYQRGLVTINMHVFGAGGDAGTAGV